MSSSHVPAGRVTEHRDPVAFGWFLGFVIACLLALTVGLLRLVGFRAELGISGLQVPLYAFMAFVTWRSARGQLVVDPATVSRPSGAFSWTIARRDIAAVAAVQPSGRTTTYLVVVPAPDCPPNRLASWWSRLWVPIPNLPSTALLCPIPADAGPSLVAELRPTPASGDFFSVTPVVPGGRTASDARVRLRSPRRLRVIARKPFRPLGVCHA